MSKDPINREILFFKDPKKKLAFILMSFKIDEAQFFELFPNTDKSTEEEIDLLMAQDDQWESVFVGDDQIIDKHFADHFKLDEDGKNKN